MQLPVRVFVEKHESCVRHVSEAMRLKTRLTRTAEHCGLVSCQPINLWFKGFM
jgi:hypothetical protein